jgi:hypothetical protein
MTRSFAFRTLLVSALLCLLAACETNPPIANTQEAAPEVAFLDLDKFDHQLAQSLSSPLKEVNVPLLEHVSPNKMPERLKVWLNHVEKNGGKIQVQEPPSSSGVTAKNPFLIFSLINAMKTLNDLSKKAENEKNFFSNVQGHDVKIMLANNANNEVVVQKLVFLKTAAK